MHRQSLGSPSPKLPKEDTDDKRHRLSSPPPPPPPHRFIHLIPLLTLFCFFILYLCSHTPSSSDSAAKVDGGIEHYMDIKRSGDVLAIRSLRSLQQIPKSRLHRKLADF